jgi:2-oxoglutarate ferredoxin oxidoreductase subunit beta
MTGGQISPTSPTGSFGTTAPYGNQDTPFKLAELVAAAGASYSARWTTVQMENLVLSIKDGLKNPGFSFIEVATQCPTYYGRKNKLKTPTAMAAVMKANTIFKSEADRMRPRDVEGKIVVGEFANTQRDEFTQNIEKLSVEKSGKKTLINSAYETEL